MTETKKTKVKVIDPCRKCLFCLPISNENYGNELKKTKLGECQEEQRKGKIIDREKNNNCNAFIKKYEK